MMVPDWKLERYLRNALSEKEMRELRALEKSDDIFRARVVDSRQSDKEILAQYPFESLEGRLTGKGFAEGRSLNFLWLKVACAAVFAVAVISFMYLGFGSVALQTPQGTQEGVEVALGVQDQGTRIKGMDVRMELWKKTASGVVQLENLSNAREGDEVQLRYSVPQKCFGILFSMDGNGVLTVHMGSGNDAVALSPGKMTALPFAYKFDDAPYFEKFF